MATKLRTFHWPPNKMIPHWPLSIGFLARATKFGTFHWSPSKMLPHWPPSIGFLPRATKLGTFHWSPSWGLPSPPSFSFSLKRQIHITNGLFFSDIIFYSNLKNTCSITFFGRNDQSWYMVERKIVDWMFVVFLKKWKRVGIVLKA